jgi:site-specific DNA recombinase
VNDRQLTSFNNHQAIGYCRVSTVGQSGIHHCSLETQLQRYNSYCQTHNIKPVGTFSDVASGRRDDRREYQAMLRFLQDKNADIVVVQYLDRFGRNPKEILTRIWKLQDIGVEVVATDEDIKEELILLVRAGLAGAESKKTSARIKANIGRAVARGVHVGRPPYGFDGIRKIDSDGRARISEFVINPAEAEIIKLMYILTAEQNHGFKYISDHLNSLGYRGRAGNIFTGRTVRIILTSPALKGTLAYGNKQCSDFPLEDLVIIDNFFPRIFSDEQWQKLQTSLAVRRDSRSHGRIFTSGYLLSGIARCGYCGGPIVGKLASQDAYIHRRYYCHRALTSRLMCDHRNSHRADALESAVLEELGQYADRKKTIELLSRMEKAPGEDKCLDSERLAKDIKVCEQEFALHLRLLKEGHITEEQFALANQPIGERHKNLLQRMNDSEHEVKKEKNLKAWHRDLAKMLTTFLEDFKKLPLPQQKAKLIEVISEIRIYKDKPIEIYLRDEPIITP